MLQTFIVPDAGIQTKEALLQDATDWQTAMALSKMRLFTDALTSVGPNTSKAALVAAECTFDGYTAGGKTITAFNEPFVDEAGEVVCLAPLVQFNYTDGVPHVHENAQGFWVEDAAGKVRLVGLFEGFQSMDDNSDSIPIIAGKRFKN